VWDKPGQHNPEWAFVTEGALVWNDIAGVSELKEEVAVLEHLGIVARRLGNWFLAEETSVSKPCHSVGNVDEGDGEQAEDHNPADQSAPTSATHYYGYRWEERYCEKRPDS